MDFIKNFFVCDKDVMQLDDLITYVSLVQEIMREYRTDVDSNQW